MWNPPRRDENWEGLGCISKQTSIGWYLRVETSKKTLVWTHAIMRFRRASETNAKALHPSKGT